MTRQPRAEIWIPCRKQRVPSLLELTEIKNVLESISAGCLVMHQRRKRCVYNELSSPVRPQTQVEVVVDDLVGFLEPAQFPIQRTPHQHARASYGDDVALGESQTEIARLVRCRETERMARCATRG